MHAAAAAHMCLSPDVNFVALARHVASAVDHFSAAVESQPTTACIVLH